MHNIYEVKWLKDSEYVVYYWNPEGDYFNATPLFTGTITEVEAWVSLKTKGYNF